MKIEKYLESTNLKIDATEEDILKLLVEAEKYKFHGVCVHPSWISFLAHHRKNRDIKLIQVLDFPFGQGLRKYRDINMISDEIDMVMNLSLLKSGRYQVVYNDISSIKKLIGKKILKVIIETTKLDEEEIRTACRIVEDAGADYVKTNTGIWKQRKRSLEKDVKIIKEVTNLPIKVAGGVKTLEQAVKFIGLGVVKIGTSSAVKIAEERNG